MVFVPGNSSSTGIEGKRKKKKKESCSMPLFSAFSMLTPELSVRFDQHHVGDAYFLSQNSLSLPLPVFPLQAAAFNISRLNTFKRILSYQKPLSSSPLVDLILSTNSIYPALFPDRVRDILGPFSPWNTETSLLLNMWAVFKHSSRGTVWSICNYSSAHHSKAGCIFWFMPLVCKVHQVL